MVKVFISYSRVDSSFTKELVDLLRIQYGHENVWYDANLGQRAGELWWDEILKQIDNADIFIYLLSNESVKSIFCQAEFQEAQRLRKRIITVQARDRTELIGDLSAIQYVDMKHGVDDIKAYNNLLASIRYQESKVKNKERPLSKNKTPRPDTPKYVEPHVRENSYDIVTPNLYTTQFSPPVSDIHQSQQSSSSNLRYATNNFNQQKRRSWIPYLLIGFVLFVISLICFMIFAFIIGNNLSRESPTAQTTPTATLIPSTTPTATFMPTHTPTTLTIPTDTVVPTVDTVFDTDLDGFPDVDDQCPTLGGIVGVNGCPDADGDGIRDIDDSCPLEAGTQADGCNPPLDSSEVIDDSLVLALDRARTFAGTQNSDWQPFEYDFDGVTMVLVPVGCFMMGSSDAFNHEQPVHEQCFDEPFWIDKYEVTQGQVKAFDFDNDNWFDGDNRPAEQITWFEANEFCYLRNAQLPTEREWEYASRGVESWIYPWGNEFIDDNAVFSSNSGNQTSEVGGRPNGASWVGAMDMSGNVWEWTSSLYEDYPYDVDDGREADTGERMNVLRVLRDGGFPNVADNLRSASRIWVNPSYMGSFVGVRCARSYE